MAKVKDVMGEGSTVKVNPLQIADIDQNRLWVHYDPEADSLVIYTTGTPTFAVSIDVQDDMYVKVNPVTGDIVGFHIEAWERKFVPAHPDIQAVWHKMKLHLEPELGWSQLLRMLALWLIFVFKSDHRTSFTPQLAW